MPTDNQDTLTDNYPSLSEIKGNNAEIIKKAIHQALNDELLIKCHNCSWSNQIITSEEGLFAVVGESTYKLLKEAVVHEDEGYHATWEPVIIEDKCFSRKSKTGITGILHLVTVLRRNHKNIADAEPTPYFLMCEGIATPTQST